MRVRGEGEGLLHVTSRGGDEGHGGGVVECAEDGVVVRELGVFQL